MNINWSKEKWSEIYKLDADPGHIPERPGVYRIWAFVGGRPAVINRCGGCDQDGILHIGETGNLNRRFIQFRDTVQGLRRGSAAFARYDRYGFRRVFTLEQLRFDFIQTTNKEKAVAEEANWHRAYAYSFLDHPPLDSSSGPRFDRKYKNEILQALQDDQYLR